MKMDIDASAEITASYEVDVGNYIISNSENEGGLEGKLRL